MMPSWAWAWASAASTSSQDWKRAASVNRARTPGSSIRSEVGSSSMAISPRGASAGAARASPCPRNRGGRPGVRHRVRVSRTPPRACQRGRRAPTGYDRLPHDLRARQERGVMGKLDGKVALISGGGRGQGAAEADTFAREGARVVFGDILDAEGRKVESAIRAAGGEATYVHLDVTSEADWQSAVQTAIGRYGGLNILV